MPPSPLLPVLVVVATLLMLALAVRARRRRTTSAVADAHEPAVVAVPHAGPDEERSPTVRALRAQVRVLEEALTLCAGAMGAGDGGRTGQPLLVVAESAPGDVAAYRRQVASSLRAVAAATAADADAPQAVARVAAAVARLDAGEAFARPVLPCVDDEDLIRTRAPEAPLPSGSDDRPVLVPAASAAARSLEPAPVVHPDVVVPVPPPTAGDEPRRPRRRSRRTAA